MTSISGDESIELQMEFCGEEEGTENISEDCGSEFKSESGYEGGGDVDGVGECKGG